MRRYGKATSRLIAESARHYILSGAQVAYSCSTDSQKTKMQKAIRERSRTIRIIRIDESEMWRYKRERQRRDLNALESGALTNEDVNWFAGVGRKAKIIGSLFG